MHLNITPDYNSKEKVMRIVIVIPSNIYFQSGIRDFSLQMVRNLTESSEQWAFRFQTIVDELCNNAIEHGSQEGEDIALTYYVKPGKWLEFIVEDKGTGPHPLKARQLEAMVDERAKDTKSLGGMRGRGLSRIVKKWADDLTFEDREGGGLRVKMRKNL